MTYNASYDALNDETGYFYSWTPGKARLPHFRPGQRIQITIIFKAPLVVAYDHTREQLHLLASHGTSASGTCGAAAATLSVTVTGNWPLATSTQATSSPCTGDALYCGIFGVFTDLTANEELGAFEVEFTVPDTFATYRDAGEPIPAVDMELSSVQFQTVIPGPRQAPPIWPKGQPLP